MSSMAADFIILIVKKGRFRKSKHDNVIIAVSVTNDDWRKVPRDLSSNFCTCIIPP